LSVHDALHKLVLSPMPSAIAQRITDRESEQFRRVADVPFVVLAALAAIAFTCFAFAVEAFALFQ